MSKHYASKGEHYKKQCTCTGVMDSIVKEIKKRTRYTRRLRKCRSCGGMLFTVEVPEKDYECIKRYANDTNDNNTERA